MFLRQSPTRTARGIVCIALPVPGAVGGHLQIRGVQKPGILHLQTFYALWKL